jgi:hypothetical protein
MKGTLKTEEIGDKKFDIRKGGATIALETQSIFHSLLSEGRVPLDSDISNAELQFGMMRGMTRDNVKRIKELFMECIVSPKINDDSFEELDPDVITQLFMVVYYYQTGSANKKKEKQNESTE